MIISPYIDLYDIIIPKNHELRQLNELVDLSFADDLLKNTYASNNGRPGYRPQVMFKYLMLKRMYELSDRDVVERARTDMTFKYFLVKLGIGMQLFACRTIPVCRAFLFCDCIFRITILLTILVSENTTNRLVIQLPVHRTGVI